MSGQLNQLGVLLIIAKKMNRLLDSVASRAFLYEGVKFGEISRIVADRWRQMTDAEKQVNRTRKRQLHPKNPVETETPYY